ncbi:MAG: dephospho-CoA kinase, partial [Planctomycetota bacterium]
DEDAPADASDPTEFGPPPGVEVVGFVGGVASGKTTLARWFAHAQRWPLVEADEVAYRMLRDDGVVGELRGLFGGSVFRATGSVDRRALAGAARQLGPDGVKTFKKITDEAVRAIFRDEVHAAASFRPRPDRILVDAPALLESGLGPLCTKLIFVETKESVRQGRAIRTRGWSLDEWKRREAVLWPLERKRETADVVVAASTSVGQTGADVLGQLSGPPSRTATGAR